MIYAIKKILSLLATLCLWSAPLLICWFANPFNPETTPKFLPIALCISLYLVLFLMLRSQKICAKLIQGETKVRKTGKLLIIIALILASYSLIALSNFSYVPYFFIAINTFLIAASLFLIYLGVQNRIAYSGLVGLLVVFALIVSGELFLERFPTKYLHASVAQAPRLVPIDQVNVVYKKNGFRGKFPCEYGKSNEEQSECQDKPFRIVTLGGSSTYGVPLVSAQRTYPQILENMLSERNPEQRFEVLNAGIAAYGIMQVISALDEEILQYKPDVVMVNSWFNDSGSSPRWYRVPFLSDREAYYQSRILKKIQENAIFSFFHSTRIFSLFRYTLVSLKEKGLSVFANKDAPQDSGRPRMTKDEFEWALEKIVEMGKEHDFLPVFLTEPVNRSKSLEEVKKTNGYIQKIYKTAEKHDLHVVNLLDAFHENRDKWFFYDFIHPNQEGHELIAQTVYNSLFIQEPSKATVDFFKQKNIAVDSRNIAAAHTKLVKLETDGSSSIQIQASAPFSNGESIPINISIDNKLITTKELKNETLTFQIPVSKNQVTFPLAELRISPHTPLTNYNFASPTNWSGPFFLEAESGGLYNGRTALIKVNGVRHDFNHRGYNLAVIGATSGSVKKTVLFDIFGRAKTEQNLADYITEASDKYKEAGKNPIIVISVKTDGSQNIDKSSDMLSSSLRSIGASGTLPNPYESFLVIGSKDCEAGQALELKGLEHLRVTLGDPSMPKKRLIELAGLSVD